LNREECQTTVPKGQKNVSPVATGNKSDDHPQLVKPGAYFKIDQSEEKWVAKESLGKWVLSGGSEHEECL
jgi:hypothetical protein